MKNYLVIGNPIKHSNSPKLHNYWFKQNRIDAKYLKKSLNENELEKFINKIRKKKIQGANITTPFKEKIIPYIDKLTDEANEAKSVNTVYLNDNKVIGHNTDIEGFYLSCKTKNIDFENEDILVLGSGGVTPSIIIGLKKLGAKKIMISNRTKDKAVKLKQKFDYLEILDWEEKSNAKIVINTTSFGLKNLEKFNSERFSYKPGNFFYDVIYEPKETNFLKDAKEKGCLVQNGLMMFIYQAAESFKTWHNVKPRINRTLINYLQND